MHWWSHYHYHYRRSFSEWRQLGRAYLTLSFAPPIVDLQCRHVSRVASIQRSVWEERGAHRQQRYGYGMRLCTDKWNPGHFLFACGSCAQWLPVPQLRRSENFGWHLRAGLASWFSLRSNDGAGRCKLFLPCKLPRARCPLRSRMHWAQLSQMARATQASPWSDWVWRAKSASASARLGGRNLVLFVKL